jgi:hypothetical protein
LWPWLKSWERWWPFALARTVRQLRAKLHKAEQENEKRRDGNEQLQLENRSQQIELDQVKEELGHTKHDKAILRQERNDLQADVERLRNEIGLPIDANTRQEFVECHFRLIDLLKLAGEDGTIEDKTFRDCIIEGPAVVTRKAKPLRGSQLRGRGVTARATVKRHDTSYIYGDPDSIFYEVPVGGENASGVIHLIGCDFIGTKLKDIAVVGTKEELQDWKCEFNYHGKYGE